ncbi:MAG: lysophospholipase [Chloroflexota bacterium]
MDHFETTLTASDGLQLYCQGWEPPESQARAAICLVHGLGEHSGRYAHVADFLTQAGYAVIAADLRGHGKSGGQRGHASSFEAFMSDIDQLFAEADRRYPGLPRFLYGHSLGGLLVLNYALRRKPDLRGVVATSSALHSPLMEQKLKIGMAKLLSKVTPNTSLATGLDANTISHDPAVVEAYKQDPLVHGVATFAMTASVIQAIEYAFAHAAEFPVSLLLVHGTADKLTYSSGSQEFAKLVPAHCTLKLWEGLAHETHNEPEKEAVLGYLLGWLDSQLLVESTIR